ncbi:MAG: LPS-assembly protein LptD, partial [Campylobacterota bacterium]
MFRFVVLFLLSFTLIYAQKQYELTCVDIDIDGDVIQSDDGVVLLHEDKYFYAKKVIYNSEKKIVQLFGDVLLIDANQITLASNEARIDLQNEESLFVPFFFVDDDSKLWIKAKEGEHKQNLYFAQDALTSSCDPNDPDWAIKFSSMKHDAQAQTLSMVNPVLYIHDVPVFYLPYLKVSTNRERKTGLLTPLLGVSGDDGFFYEQPIFIAPSLWWDLELNPQIRTERSRGLHTTFRFVDSVDSSGHIKVGRFEIEPRYVKKYDLENDRSKGFEFFYDDASVFSGFQDGLYLDIKDVSSIDYFDYTTQEEVSASVTGELVESKINYYARDEHYFGGIYAKHYDDMSKESNDDTLQQLPKTQLHKFSNRLLVDNLLYSADITHSNYTRREGLEATQVELSAPITFYSQALGDYLNFSLSENLYMTHVNFSDDSSDYEYYRNYHEAEIFTDLIKPYKYGYHNIKAGARYTLPAKEKEDIKYEDLNPIQQQMFAVTTPARGYNLYLKQYFYGFNEEEIIYHSLNQPYSYDKDDKRVTGEMENTFRFSFGNDIDLGLKTYYSHEEADFSSVLSTFSLRKKLYDMTLRHLYSNDFEGNYNSYLTAAVGYNFFEYR